jgi:transcriptional regulator with XRE-family HTH domain
METIGFSAGGFLREWRQQRGWSLAQVAQRAGIVKSTLSKWENGQVLPRLPELLKVFSILEVPVSEQAALLQQRGRVLPEAVKEPERASTFQAIPKSFPLHGDLLRAMRHRALLTQQETAQRLQISQGTLAKWEHGIDWPRTERLQALAFTLGATVEEAAALTAGAPAAFSVTESVHTEADLAAIEEEIRELKARYFYQPFEPHDLWFLSLQARLWAPSFREDGVGQKALFLWARVMYLYVAWLHTCYRADTAQVARRCMERVLPYLERTPDSRLLAVYIWVAMKGATSPLEHSLYDKQNFLQGRRQKVTVPLRTVQSIRQFSQLLETQMHSVDRRTQTTIRFARACHDMLWAFMASLEGDSETAAFLDARGAAVYANVDDSWAHVDVDSRRSQIHYYRGDVQRALEILPALPAAVPSVDATQLSQMIRLEQLGFRGRALWETGKKSQAEEGYHLLEAFNREVELLPPSPLRTHLGPLPLPANRG